LEIPSKWLLVFRALSLLGHSTIQDRLKDSARLWNVLRQAIVAFYVEMCYVGLVVKECLCSDLVWKLLESDQCMIGSVADVEEIGSSKPKRNRLRAEKPRKPKYRLVVIAWKAKHQPNLLNTATVMLRACASRDSPRILGFSTTRWTSLKHTRRRKYATVTDLSNYPKVGEHLHGFTLKRTKHIPELELTALRLQHNKTGADYLHVARDDKNNVFSIGFKTNPPDDTGVPHILEHTTLCGSQKSVGSVPHSKRYLLMAWQISSPRSLLQDAPKISLQLHECLHVLRLYFISVRDYKPTRL